MRILVHVHLYYVDMWPELKSAISHITAPYDLFVTVAERNVDIEKDILAFNPEARVITVENKGFDVWPFISVLNSVNLNDYSHIIKLHTKRDMPAGTIRNGFDVSGGKWRRYLFAFLKSKRTFEKCLKAFDANITLGMITDYRLIVTNDRKNQDASQKAQAMLSNLGLKVQDHPYVMGTMFFARTDLFSKIQEMNITAELFAKSEHGTADVLPFAFERLFGYIIAAQGYGIKDVLISPTKQFYGKTIAQLQNFLWRKKVTSSGKTIVKFCKIPVFVSKNNGGQNAL